MAPFILGVKHKGILQVRVVRYSMFVSPRIGYVRRLDLSINSKIAILQKSHRLCGSTGGMLTRMDRAHGARGMMRKITRSEADMTTSSGSWNLAQIGGSHTPRNLTMG
jgi:hypothetical protein